MTFALHRFRLMGKRENVSIVIHLYSMQLGSKTWITIVMEVTMKKSWIVLLVVLSYSVAFSQNGPEILWQKTYGIDGRGLSVIETSEGNFVTLTTEYPTCYNILLSELSPQGTILWSKSLGFADGQASVGGFSKTSDNGYIITGYVDIGNGDDAFLIKTDSSGNEEWSKVIYHGSYDQCSDSIIQTFEGGYALTGREDANYGNHRLMLIKTDANGNETFKVNYDYKKRGYSILQTSDLGFIIVGTDITSTSQIFVLKTNLYGVKEWSYLLASGDGYSIKPTTDGGYIIAGTSSDSKSMVLIKITDSGTKEWVKNFSNSGLFTFGYSAVQTLDGGYAISGYSGVDSQTEDMYLIKTDSDGIMQWSKTISYNEGSDCCYDVIQCSNRKFALIGSATISSQNKSYLVILDAVLNCDFTSNVSSGNKPLDVTFFDSSSPEDILTSWQWDFNNDGTIDSYDQNPTFTYTQAGVYDVSLTVSNGTVSDTELKKDFITVYDEALPTILSSFTATQSQTNAAAIQWTTQSESGLLGFTLYKSETANQQLSQIVNLSPIPACNTSHTQSYSYTDNDVTARNTYHYWLEAVALDGSSELFGPVMLTISEPGTAPPSAAYVTKLCTAYPNPFNPSTAIPFSLKEPSHVKIEVFNTAGQKIQTLIDSEYTEGEHQAVWDGTNSTGSAVSSGIYLYRMKAGTFTDVQKVILMK